MKGTFDEQVRDLERHFDRWANGVGKFFVCVFAYLVVALTILFYFRG